MLIMKTLERIHPGEPCFFLRARDCLAIATLEHYAALCQRRSCATDHLDGIDQAIAEFRRWQADHETKLPD